MAFSYPGGIISKTPVTPDDGVASGIWKLSEQAYWIKQGGWLEVPDPNFKDVTLLLNGDGVNGAQNNTFLDSSTNNFTITRNGNTTQGNLSPYGKYWGVNFNGNNWLAISPTSATNLGTGNFTMETWMYVRGSGGQVIAEQAVFDEGGGNNTGWILYATETSVVFGNAVGGTYISVTPTLAPRNRWTHVALVRSGATDIKLYIDGVLAGSTSTNVNMNMALDVRADTPFLFGCHELQLAGSFFNGYLSNFRLVKGSAVYTSNFTPSNEPLTAISGTSILTFQKTGRRDNSGNNLSLVRSYAGYTSPDTTSTQRFLYFGTDTTRDVTAVGSGGYFDGTGDYLSVPSSAAFGYGTGDFSLEFWAYPSSLSDNNRVIFHTDDAFNLELTGSGVLQFFQFPTAYTGGSYVPNAWVHCCITRVGSTARMFVNGTLVNNFTFTATKGNSAVQIGANAGSSQWFNGYLSNVRIVKGGIPSAYLTSSTINGTQVFTPPTAPFTGSEALTGGSVSLLLPFSNAGIADLASQNVIETVGNAQVSTSVKKYGTGSIVFDGAGDWLTCPAAPQWLMSGDWTMECWIYPTSVSGVNVFIDTRNRVNGATSPVMYLNGTSLVIDTGAAPVISAGTISTNTWYHVAATRSGNSWRLFIDGTQVGSTTTNTTSYTVAYGCTIGSSRFDEHFDGYIDDIRITNGLARYTANFTPPTKALKTK